MLYNVIQDGEELYYVPSTAGYILLAALFVALLAAAAWFAAKKAGHGSLKLTTKQLTFCAISITLGTVLSNVKLFSFPFGGSVTLLSMLFICLPGYWFGSGAGLATGVAYGILQLMIKPEIVHPAQLPIDYILAFGALGLSGLLAARKTLFSRAMLWPWQEDGSLPAFPAGCSGASSPGKAGIPFPIPSPTTASTSLRRLPSHW